MQDYAKRSLIYTAGVILTSALILICRSSWLNKALDWAELESNDTEKSRLLRAFCRNWRTTEEEIKAQALLKESVNADLQRLRLTSYVDVEKFIKTYPEVHPVLLRDLQYEALVTEKDYWSLWEYCTRANTTNRYYKSIESLLDAVAHSNILKAVEYQDVEELRSLSRNYSGWKNFGVLAKRKADEVQEFLDKKAAEEFDNEAKRVWEDIKDLKDEVALKSFSRKFAKHHLSNQVKIKLDELYADIDYVISKRSFKACVDFVNNHPESKDVNRAWSYICDELEDFVFKRKSLGANSALIKSTLERFKVPRPYSGGLYGTGGRYVSPLQITTPYSSSHDYFVKLVNKKTGASVGIYVRGGTTTEVSVPDGIYSVRYATGSQWYGTRFLFGLNASYSSAGRDFIFSNGSGYTLTLQKVAHGNLHTAPISADEF